MKKVEELAKYLASVTYKDLSKEAIQALKIRLLDSFGCAIGALKHPVMINLKHLIDDFGGKPLATLIGGGKTSPDRAAFYNCALIRFLDFNDSFLAKKETCHPSDNIGAVLAAAEYVKGSGRVLLLALACAYQVQCVLSQFAPVRDKGFDHTTQGGYSVAAGVSKVLGLNEEQSAHALAIAGVSNNPLRVTRTGALSNWKGLAFPFTAFVAIEAAFLASRNISGPLEIFEGNKGFMQSIAGPFEIKWIPKDLEAVTWTIIKKYNAEIHSQTTLEGILELKGLHHIDPDKIKRIDVEVFDVAFNIIGGGEEGGKKEIRTKEEADHSLPYMIAAALLDGEVTPAQYLPERIVKKDIQGLLQKVYITPSKEFSQQFPHAMKTKIVMRMDNGATYQITKDDYEGFITKPLTWNKAIEKFESLTEGRISSQKQKEITEVIRSLETLEVTVLTQLLGEL